MIAYYRRDLVACSRVCKALQTLANTVIVKHRELEVDDLSTLRRRLQQLPILADLIEHLDVQSDELLSTFPIEFAGKLHRVDSCSVTGGDAALSLRTQSRLAFAQWGTITILELYNVIFSTFTEFVRFVSCLPNLRQLLLFDVSHKTGEMYNLKRAAFAQRLSLQYFRNISRDISPCWRILTAPRLSQSLTRLEVDINEVILRQCGPLPRLQLPILQTLGVQFFMNRLPALSSLFAIFLSQWPQNHISTIEITFLLYPEREPQLFGSDRKLSRHCLDMIDRALCLPQFKCLQRVNVKFTSLYFADDAEYLRSNGVLLFPRLGVRRILNLSMSGKGVDVVEMIVDLDIADHVRQ
ncbi:hypothetical protein OBBRIDRAFT_487688 [Obba rivulosa]|uniref:F-box domain-containing protein n=1 Tax=Obba rivulosa TaxID=1052685 RepID=A0A8E2DKW0_9APHY|nr:hypothetical protein OBBRIDRAFT_487688 [Obba rivulosa]